jgi:6-phosphogluconolactonase (cycloisomerase 2 family)
VGGQSSGKLTAYRIDQNTGLLFTVQTYHGGDSLVWVLVVELHHANE